MRDPVEVFCRVRPDDSEEPCVQVLYLLYSQSSLFGMWLTMVEIEVKTAKIVVETNFFKVTDDTTLKLVPPEISRSYNNKETQCSFKRNIKTFHMLSSIAMMLNL